MTTLSVELQRTPHSRVFFTDGGASPANRPDYASLARATGVSQSFGDVSPVRIPSPDKYDDFVVVEVIQGQADLPTIDIEFRKQRAISMILKSAKKRCRVDLQIHIGACKNPSDFDRGYELIGVLRDARITNYSTDDLGAFDGDANAVVMETVSFTALEYFEIAPVTASKVADSQISDEITRVIICDAITCGECGLPSDGTNIAFALQAESSGSPGLGAKVFYTKDGGVTWGQSNVLSASIGETIADMVCQGPYLVVLAGGAQDRIHYALINDVLNGVANWKAVSTGFVAAGSPVHFGKYDNETVFICGEQGYIYLLTDAPKGVTVLLTGGSLTSVTLRDINCINGKDVLVVGDSNTILASANGGLTFATITGPAAGAGLRINCCWTSASGAWFIGYQNGLCYYSIDRGISWATVNMVAQNEIYDIAESNDTVLWIASRTGSNKGAVLRSVSGGYSFVQIEQVNSALFPDCRSVTSIAATGDNANVIFAGGLASDLNDGILLKIA